jgi:hypothetical protein
VRDLSLHILDILENSVRAGASAVEVSVGEAPLGDRLIIRIEDDGPGLPVRPDQALDPFFSTKPGHRVGLGLSLLRDAAEEAGGHLELGISRLGGLAVEASFGLAHIDRLPLGDLAASLSVIACTHPEIEVTCRLKRGAQDGEVRLSRLRAELPPEERTELALALRLAERVRAAIADVGVTA